MTGQKIEQALTAMRLCSVYDKESCKLCPYNTEGDKKWECLDALNRDVIGIIKWSYDTYQTINNFLNPEKE